MPKTDVKVVGNEFICGGAVDVGIGWKGFEARGFADASNAVDASVRSALCLVSTALVACDFSWSDPSLKKRDSLLSFGCGELFPAKVSSV